MLKVNTEKILLARAKEGMTIDELVERSKVGRATISRIENGKVEPNPLTVGKIARALNVPIESLFTEE